MFFLSTIPHHKACHTRAGATLKFAKRDSGHCCPVFGELVKMTEEKEQPFADVLLELFEAEPLPIPKLYRLSDMQPDEMALFDTGWTAVPDERRQIIVRHLADIAEDNFIVDFTAVFIRGFNDSVAEVRMASLDGLWDTSDLKLIPPITNLLNNDPRRAGTGRRSRCPGPLCAHG
jgi:hypothetical protein